MTESHDHGSGEPPADSRGHLVEAEPGRDERLAGALAMLSFWLFDLVGQVLVLWWARRHASTYARRYAWASLALDGAVLVVGLAVVVVHFVVPSTLFFLAFWSALLLEMALVVLAVAMAVRAWRGHDVADGPLPSWFTDRLPPR